MANGLDHLVLEVELEVRPGRIHHPEVLHRSIDEYNLFSNGQRKGRAQMKRYSIDGTRGWGAHSVKYCDRETRPPAIPLPLRGRPTVFERAAHLLATLLVQGYYTAQLLLQ